MPILTNIAECKWTVRNKRIFFQDWEKKQSPFLIPQLFIAFHTEI